MSAVQVCDFDGGPFHDADVEVPLFADGDLPSVVVTYLDKDEWWATYVLSAERFSRVPDQRTYCYDGPASEAEILLCPRIPADARVESGYES